MGKPLNQNPEDYAKDIIKKQQDEIARLNQELENQPGGGPPDSPSPQQRVQDDAQETPDIFDTTDISDTTDAAE